MFKTMNDFNVMPQLGFGEALNEAKGKLTQFTGRSRRSEFWWTYLAVIIANIVLSLIPLIGHVISFLLGLAVIPLTFRRLHDTGRSGWWWGVQAIGTIIGYSVIFAAIGLDNVEAVMSGNYDPMAVADNVSGGSAALVLICALVGLVYNIAVLVFLCQDSQKGTNKYGDSPKYVYE